MGGMYRQFKSSGAPCTVTGDNDPRDEESQSTRGGKTPRRGHIGVILTDDEPEENAEQARVEEETQAMATY